MQKQRFLKVLLAFMVILNIINCIPVNATQVSLENCLKYNYGYSTISGRYSNTATRPQLRVLQHSNGRICIVTSRTDGQGLSIRVHSQDGTQLGIINISSSQYNQGGISIAEYSSNEIIVAYSSASGQCVGIFTVYNIITFSYSYTQTVSFPDVSAAESTDIVSEIFKYQNNFYCLWAYASYYGGSGIAILKFNSATHTASNLFSTKKDPAHSGYINEIMGFLDETNGKIYYAIEYNYKKPAYYVADLNLATWTELCINPIGDVLPESDNEQYEQRFHHYFQQLDGGIYVDGTQKYLYFSWCYAKPHPSSTQIERKYRIVTWIGKFNNTISSGSLISQTCFYEEFGETEGSTYSNNGMIWGYKMETTSPELKYNVIYSMFLFNHYQSNRFLTINDLTTMPTAYDEIDGSDMVDNEYIAYVSDSSNSYKIPSARWSYHEVDATHSYIVTGENVTVLEMDDTFSYSPNDTPLKTGKTYVFEYVIYKNGVIDLDEDSYNFYFGGMLKKQGVMSETGTISIPIQVNAAGEYGFKIDIYDGNTRIYSSNSRTLTWIGKTVDEEEATPQIEVAITFYQFISNWLPSMLCVMVPSLTLAMVGSKLSPTGAIIGLLMGGLTGVITGVYLLIMPTYALYLYLLLLGISVVMMSRSG